MQTSVIDLIGNTPPIPLRRLVPPGHGCTRKFRRRSRHHAGYAQFQKRRKKIKEPFGWAKTIGGIECVRARFTLTIADCNLARLRRLHSL